MSNSFLISGVRCAPWLIEGFDAFGPLRVVVDSPWPADG
jgi:hypothetical protein